MVLKEDRITDKTIAKLRSLNYGKLINHEEMAVEWLNMDIELLIVLLEHLQPPSEIYIAHLVFSWLEHNLQHRKIKFETLISNLRLVNLPQSFINDVILKFADVHKVDSTNLYRMILGTQTYFFSLRMGGIPRRKTRDNFPKVYESRESYLKMEELEFRIPIQDLANKDFTSDSVWLIYDDKTDRFHLAFNKRCCFVYITNEQLVAENPISKILVPVQKCGDSEDGIVIHSLSKEIGIINDVLFKSESDKDVLQFLSFVAVFLHEN
jgi:hypothetical protein